MQRRFLGIALLSLWAFLLCGQVPLPLTELPSTGSAALSEGEMAVTPEGVRLQIKERPLQEVLQSIEAASGIRFSLPHTLLQVPVTVTLEAPDWPTAVRQLLRPFQTAEVWQEGHTQLRQVFILDRAPPGSSPGSTPPAPQGTAVPPETRGPAGRPGAP